jgi:hypothetical protein
MEKLKIFIPSDNLNERTYIIQTLIGQFLGLSYELHVSEDQANYIIQYKNKKIIINDAFFCLYKEPLSYLNHNNLPHSLLWLTSFQSSVEKIPIIYGDNCYTINQEIIYVGLDIFASSFFMLTRWEEIVIPKKDVFGRCAESEMFVVKNNLTDRPVVNEYCLFLKGLLLNINVGFTVLPCKFSAMITHDVDFLFRYGSLFSLGQNLAGDIINRKSLRSAMQTISGYIDFRRGIIKDPFDTFNELMDASEKHGLKSSFYFKPSVLKETDCTYDIFDKRVIEIINRIERRGHEVGIHPSKNTFHNEEQFYSEVHRMRSLDVPISGGRQHYLLYDVSETFNYWEKASLEYDNGLGFSGILGFRCGVCWPFNVFDIKRRRTLKLIEKPLCVMEAAILTENPDPEILYANIQKVLNQIKKHSGLFVFLWHNDGFNRPEYVKYKEVYNEILQSI